MVALLEDRCAVPCDLEIYRKSVCVCWSVKE